VKQRSKGGKPLVFVTVGTDHHPFDRLVRWVDGWLEAGASDRVRCLVQFGTSRPPLLADGRDYLSYEEVRRAMAEAVAVVTHGGPGSVMSCRWSGKVPVVVPRRHDLGEHVDDHQVVFARRMALQGEMEVAEEEGLFRRALERALEDPDAFRITEAEAEAEAAAGRFRDLVEGLLAVRDGARAHSRPAGLPVLYIGGWGRSGSTLLDRVMGQVPGFFSVGELREIWQRGLAENRPCGCGAAFLDCPFWTDVGKAAFGGWEAVDQAEVLRLRYSLDRGWSLPLLLARKARLPHSEGIGKYTRTLQDLYRAIGEVSGAKVVIDSSKLPSHALLVRLVDGVDLRLVHLVRDSRGVVYSWHKRVLNRVTSGEPQYMEKYGTVSASARYVFYNWLTRLVGWLGIPYMRMRYEDFIADPRAGVERIHALLGMPLQDKDLSFVRDGSVSLQPNHTVDGNPMRFAVGSVDLRVDEEWKTGMSASDRLWVTTITSPMLLRYGYPLELRAGRER
jgi:UDP-N-acetylglucosamine transferase subunit ALG13